ncbi:hypothetical protein TNIN_60571 [Trichonephila inaurata madagascariensis]|uniref:Endonuclease/exonuclease/phosphatase domain-containing protein n=1 Tax=Trichonephila inaurata madagascariensis TaxID=2747483 RepID=A0A8X6YNJ0_9ARAC|nr:hypothetical protein TNIN_60571 [Trichonephila inaurata madagascariensis]
MMSERKLFKTQFNPRKEKIGIRDVKEISDNRIIVNCASVKDREKLMTKIEANPKFLKPTVPKRKNPTMLIRNVPNDVDDSELLDVIREQNPEILASNECWNESRVRFVLKKFQHVRERTVVIEFHPKIRKNVNAVGSLKIMWNMCRTEDFLVINRCFQCLGYNHRANECTNILSCYFCAGEHKSDTCSYRENQATQQRILNLENNNVDVALIQEPHCFRGKLPGFPNTYKIFYDTSEVIKATIIVRNMAITVFSDPRNLDYNSAMIGISFGAYDFTVFSYYFEPSVNTDLDLREIEQLFSNRVSKRHMVYGCKYTWQLFTINEDYGRTFCADQGTSYIDITAVGHNVLGLVERWFIPDYDSLSDHRMISFEMKILKSDRACDCSEKTNLFNTKRENWNMFYSQCSQAENAILDSLNNCMQPNSLELCVQDVQELITKAAEKSIPLKKSGYHKVPWWSVELFCMRKQLNAARRRYQRTGGL